MCTDEVDDESHLIQTIDYGSFPSWNSSTIQSMHLNLRLGPAPSVSEALFT